MLLRTWPSLMFMLLQLQRNIAQRNLTSLPATILSLMMKAHRRHLKMVYPAIGTSSSPRILAGMRIGVIISRRTLPLLMQRPWMAWMVMRQSYGITLRVVGESRGSKLIAAHADILYDNSRITTLADHLWILSKLLVMKDFPSEGGPAAIVPSQMSNRLLRYIIASCYKKMLCWLKHKTLSQPYSLSLQSVRDVTFNESLREQLSMPETERDRSFLVNVELN